MSDTRPATDEEVAEMWKWKTALPDGTPNGVGLMVRGVLARLAAAEEKRDFLRWAWEQSEKFGKEELDRRLAAEAERDEQEEVANNYATEVIGAEESIKKLQAENAGLREALQDVLSTNHTWFYSKNPCDCPSCADARRLLEAKP